MLKDEIRQRMVAATKAGERIEKDILKLALGEIQTVEARTGSALDDEAAGDIVRKLIKSNRESIDATADAEARARLEAEVAILDALLPRTLTTDEIVAALAPLQDAVLDAASDGQATGVAMKHLKAEGATVTGRDVSEAVRRMRS